MTALHHFHLLISCLAIAITVDGAPTRLQGASFVPPAAPSVARSAHAVSSGYGLYPITTTTTTTTCSSSSSSSSNIRSGSVLYGKKKSAPGAAATKKVQVKLLKHIAGTGQAGEVIQVTPAFFNNKLRPTKSAVIISDEDVEKEQAESKALEAETTAKATALQEKIADTTMKLTRKAGPTGQLFGGISPKCVMEELENKLGDDYLGNKNVKISEFFDENGKKMRGDLKHVGEFGARIVLKNDISAKFAIVIEAEE